MYLTEHLQEVFANVRREQADMHAYQAEAVDFMEATPFSALFIDTGLGKTIICLTLVDRLLGSTFLTNKPPKILIIAPIRVASQTWPTEIGEWRHVAPWRFSLIRAEDDDPEVISAGKEAAARVKDDPEAVILAEQMAEDAIFFAGSYEEQQKITPKRMLLKLAQSAASKARTAMKEELRQRAAQSSAPVHIIDLQHVEWLVDYHSKVVYKGKNRKKYWNVKTWPYDVVIIDESSAFKDYTTSRFRALNAIRPKLSRMHQLTATPAAETYLHLFPQIFLLDRGERLGRAVTKYRETYFDHNEYKRTYTLKPGAEKQISKKIADITLVMKSPDYLDEQPPLFLPRKMRLETWELEKYRALQEDFIYETDEGEIIEATSAGDLQQKLTQLASGAIYRNKNAVPDEDPDSPKVEPFVTVHEHKIEDLRQLREELAGEPLMVAYWHKSSLARLKKAFPDAVVMDKAGKAVKPWNAGKIQMLLVHPASVGHGLNMQYGPGHDIYFFDLCWSYELYYQLYRRLHRQGQALRVRVHLPQMIGTADEVIAARLEAKEDAQEALFMWIKALKKAANDNERSRTDTRTRRAA